MKNDFFALIAVGLLSVTLALPLDGFGDLFHRGSGRCTYNPGLCATQPVEPVESAQY